METTKFTNIELVIRRYIKGIASSDDQELLYEWIEDNPEIRDFLLKEKDIWESTMLGSEWLNYIEQEQWMKLEDKINLGKLKTYRLREIVKIAAIIIISLGLGWFGKFLHTQQNMWKQTSEIKSIEATKGQLKEIFLADGTHVWLNSDSELSFPASFNSNERIVKLRGEAYFEVTANEEKPFYVKTKSHTVKVVGTRFNICGDCKMLP